MTLRNRIQKALKQERGIRLSAAEVQGIASALHIDFPVTRPRIARRSKPSPSKTPIEGHVRWMIHRDLKDVVASDAAATCAPWSKEDYKSRLSQRNAIAMVIELPSTGRGKPVVVGAMVYQLHKQHVELERIIIKPEVQLRSFGRQAMRLLRNDGARRCFGLTITFNPCIHSGRRCLSAITCIKSSGRRTCCN